MHVKWPLALLREAQLFEMRLILKILRSLYSMTKDLMNYIKYQLRIFTAFTIFVVIFRVFICRIPRFSLSLSVTAENYRPTSAIKSGRHWHQPEPPAQ